jgi:hypothetical protein
MKLNELLQSVYKYNKIIEDRQKTSVLVTSKYEYYYLDNTKKAELINCDTILEFGKEISNKIVEVINGIRDINDIKRYISYNLCSKICKLLVNKDESDDVGSSNNVTCIKTITKKVRQRCYDVVSYVFYGEKQLIVEMRIDVIYSRFIVESIKGGVGILKV